MYEDGVVHTGGGPLLDKIGTKLSRDTGVKYITPEDPLRCVAMGTGRALEQLGELKDLMAHVQ